MVFFVRRNIYWERDVYAENRRKIRMQTSSRWKQTFFFLFKFICFSFSKNWNGWYVKCFCLENFKVKNNCIIQKEKTGWYPLITRQYSKILQSTFNTALKMGRCSHDACNSLNAIHMKPLKRKGLSICLSIIISICFMFETKHFYTTILSPLLIVIVDMSRRREKKTM